MNSVAKENTKLLTEKLSLDRELAALKPEVEHLKSQAIHQQNVLSEKLALQRQIITLEVELETEKRAAQRTARRNADAGKDAEYESRLNRLKKDHAKERKEAARSQTDSENESKLQLEDVMKQLSQEKQQAAKVAKEYEKELKQSQLRYMHAEQKIGEMLETAKSTDRSGLDAVDFKARYKALEDKLERMNEANKVTKELGKKVQACDVRNASLEDKLDQMRTRLRSMKDQLKHAQEEANRLRAKPQDEEEPRTSLPTMKQSRKRAASEIFTENNVGTPERVPRAKRLATYKGRPDQVLVGEKSMFSITPFLNRTINMASDEFAVKENENQPEFTDIKGPKSRSPTQHAAMDPIRTSPLNENIKDTHTREKKVLAETKSITKNGKIRHAKVHSSSKLEDVTEEGDENEQEGEAEEKSIDGKQLMRETSPVNTKAANSRNVLGNQKHPVDVGPRIKKRKLLGGTLFDEEDGESTRKIDAKYRIFRKGQTVIDLGYAPGSWSQVAVERTKPNGRIVGIDIIPAQPPKGVSTIQGNFLSAEVREEVKRFLSDPDRGRPKEQFFELPENPNFLRTQRAGGVELEIGTDGRHKQGEGPVTDVVRRTTRRDEDNGEVVDIVLSDMSAPWDQTTGFWKRSLSDPYNRMMNTSGIAFKDHAGSMFAFESLKTGGHFEIAEAFWISTSGETRIIQKQSKEAYFVALRKKHGVDANMLVDEEHVV
ncbi:putative Ribosomal RNA methyltransferase MRM2, mitochondrial [Glarea lozoyensis 74030]|uniref:rRNA methyltransferase 2, mitochondrial n=1 Tax=Glarea lozoyensis (strain ATCC 74030 / MF5533) TaxID=1104152 RepID=H0EM95_GLAL7|nr:putative Ribosomal RNA methyltransferase MRM2, mitochondrial [Glarea lozoyensis 74030]